MQDFFKKILMNLKGNVYERRKKIIKLRFLLDKLR